MRTVLVIGAICLVFSYLYFKQFSGGTVNWNQRMTLVIETPQGELRGSAVTKVEAIPLKGVPFLTEVQSSTSWDMDTSWVGESVVVEIVPGKWLFALLEANGKNNAGGWAYAAYDLHSAPKSSSSRTYNAAMLKLREQPMDVPVPLPADGLPMLVTFDDITKPETVREVDPEDLAAMFGEGVRLLAVTLEITDEAVSDGKVEGVLGTASFQDWAANHNAALKRGIDDPYFSSLMSTLNRNVFIADN